MAPGRLSAASRMTQTPSSALPSFPGAARRATTSEPFGEGARWGSASLKAAPPDDLCSTWRTVPASTPAPHPSKARLPTRPRWNPASLQRSADPRPGPLLADLTTSRPRSFRRLTPVASIPAHCSTGSDTPRLDSAGRKSCFGPPILQIVLPESDSAYQIALSGYSAGRMSFLDLLDAARALIQARLEAHQVRGESRPIDAATRAGARIPGRCQGSRRLLKGEGQSPDAIPALPQVHLEVESPGTQRHWTSHRLIRICRSIRSWRQDLAGFLCIQSGSSDDCCRFDRESMFRVWPYRSGHERQIKSDPLHAA